MTTGVKMHGAAGRTTRRSTGRATALVLALAALAGGCAGMSGASPAPSVAETASRYTDDVFALSAEADRAYRESRWIDAARQYQRLTDAVPADAYAWFRLGNTYAQQGAYDRAIHAYEASLARDAEQPRPWFNLSTAYLLSAQAAMLRARDQLRPGDPARELIERRLEALQTLVHGRIEDGPTRTLAR